MESRTLKKSRFILAGLAAVLWLVPGQRALASCGSEHCPLDMGGEYGAGRFSFDLSFQYINQDGVQIGTRKASVGELPSPEDEVRTRNEMISARGAFRVSERLRVSAETPWVDRLHEH